MSLGANVRTVTWLLMGSGMKLVAVGSVVGLVLSYLLSQALSGMLFGIDALDTLTFVAAPHRVIDGRRYRRLSLPLIGRAESTRLMRSEASSPGFKVPNTESGANARHVNVRLVARLASIRNAGEGFLELGSGFRIVRLSV